MQDQNKNNLIYAESSRKIIGALFEVSNNLSPDLLEKNYQKALAIEFSRREIKFEEQVSVPLIYKDQLIGRCYADFIIETDEGKIVLEIKKDHNFSRQYIEQTVKYLKAFDIKLGILANFTKQGVKFKRILNLY